MGIFLPSNHIESNGSFSNEV